jgi:transcriptional regulator with XRE-family HTH domain
MLLAMVLVCTLNSPDMQTLDHARMTTLRKALGLTQVDAAARAKMTVSRWNDIESGRRHKKNDGGGNFKLETIARIAGALEVADIRELITAPETPKRRGK